MRWFELIGPLPRPCSIAGWVVTLLALAACVAVFVQVDQKSHSVSDTFYGGIAYWLGLAVVWWVVALATSGGQRPKP